MGAKVEEDVEELTEPGPGQKAIANCLVCAGTGSLLTVFGSTLLRRPCVVCNGIGLRPVLVAPAERRRFGP
jgi:hypothetical protein